MESFRELVVYVRAVELADVLHREIASWPSFERWTTGIQLVRAADSIGANIAEASGRGNARDQRRLLLVARGSAYETEHWLSRAEARRMNLGSITNEPARELSRMLNGLIRSLDVSTTFQGARLRPED